MVVILFHIPSKLRQSAGSPSSSQILDDFRSTFKVSRKTFDYICSLVKENMMAKTHFAFTNGKPMMLNDQVALALVRLGSGNSLASIGESFGAHHSTVSQGRGALWRPSKKRVFATSSGLQQNQK